MSIYLYKFLFKKGVKKMNYNSQTYCRAIEKLKDGKGTTKGYRLMNDGQQVMELSNKEIKEQMVSGAIYAYNLDITSDGKLIHQPQYNYVGLSVPVQDFFNRKLNDNWSLLMMRPDVVVCRRLDSRASIPLTLKPMDGDLQSAFHIQATLDISSLQHEHFKSVPQDILVNPPQFKIVRADKQVDARFIEFLDKLHASKIGKVVEVVTAKLTPQERANPKNIYIGDHMRTNQARADQVSIARNLASTDKEKETRAKRKAANFLLNGFSKSHQGTTIKNQGQYI